MSITRGLDGSSYLEPPGRAFDRALHDGLGHHSAAPEVTTATPLQSEQR